MNISLPNLLSYFRGTLALAFLQENAFVRIAAIVLAMITDVLDGYIARNYTGPSFFGAVLDPLMDRFFVFFGSAVFIGEGLLSWEGFVLMLSRDVAVFAFGLYILFTGAWASYMPRALKIGKLTTALQFFVLLALVLHIALPIWIFFLFLTLGCLAFIELVVRNKVYI